MKRDAIRTKWRVQTRKSRAHKWRSRGLFETREHARDTARWFREWDNFGFGNTRVVRKEAK